MKSIRNQQGVTLIGWIIILALIAFFSLITIKVVPIYIDHYNIVKVLKSLENEDNIATMRPAEARELIDRRLYINAVETVKRDDFEIHRLSGALEIDLEYAATTNLFSNIFIVIEFKEHKVY